MPGVTTKRMLINDGVMIHFWTNDRRQWYFF